MGLSSLSHSWQIPIHLFPYNHSWRRKQRRMVPKKASSLTLTHSQGERGWIRLPRWWIGVTALLAALAILAAPLPVATAAPVERTFRIEASRFQYSPTVIQVNPGDQITIELVATDVVHGLSIDGYNLNLTADPGQTTHLNFTADRPGSFRFRCSIACGNLHPFMIGKLQVGPNMLLWKAIGLAVMALVLSVWGLRK